MCTLRKNQKKLLFRFFFFQITVFSPETHSSKLLDQVENIDSNDALNPLLMSEYVNDIYLYLNNLEIKYPVAKNHLEGQLEVSSVLLKTFRMNDNLCFSVSVDNTKNACRPSRLDQRGSLSIPLGNRNLSHDHFNN
jgi:hypothetical protein